jgi:hypothetical protein
MAKKYANDTREYFVNYELERRANRVNIVGRSLNYMHDAVRVFNSPTDNSTLAAHVTSQFFARNHYGPTSQEIAFNPIEVPIPPAEVAEVAEMSGAVATEAVIDTEPIVLQPEVEQQVYEQQYTNLETARMSIDQIFEDSKRIKDELIAQTRA